MINTSHYIITDNNIVRKYSINTDRPIKICDNDVLMFSSTGSHSRLSAWPVLCLYGLWIIIVGKIPITI